MGIINSIKTTGKNVLNANKNAKKAQLAEKQAKKNMIIGGTATAATGIVAVATNLLWRRKYLSMSNRLDECERETMSLKLRIDGLVEEGGIDK